MNAEELKALLDKLRSLPSETEWVEFKKARSDFDFRKLGQYFSALGNEANLKSEPCGWLIFGVEDKTRKVVGTHYRSNRSNLDRLKSEIANKTNNHITFIDIYELLLPEGRIIMFQIPAAPQGIPVAWEGHYYGRDGESIGALNIQEIEQIRNQTRAYDWSAQICRNATLDDLDPQAIAKAREQYKEKNKNSSSITLKEIDSWEDITFLNKARVTIHGEITNTAILLLGKPESEHFLSPSVARITWLLKDDNDIKEDYEHFGPPFLVNVDSLFSRIRNLNYRFLPSGTLFPAEISQYDNWVIREALHNCIAHQDYELRGKINVIEKSDELIFLNVGNFIPGNIETVIRQDAPPAIYRNPFLAHAMVAMNMIDTIGGGIKRMFLTQKQRYFPLPDYDLSQLDKVSVTIQGKVIDENYTRLLMEKTNLDLQTVILLDRVQKDIRLTKDQHNLLKRRRLIEGRYPNVYVSSKVATVTGRKAKYIRDRGFDDSYCQELVLAFIKKYGTADRKDIDELLMDKLPDVLSLKQKSNKINRLLSHKMSKELNLITNIGSRRSSSWILVQGKGSG